MLKKWVKLVKRQCDKTQEINIYPLRFNTRMWGQFVIIECYQFVIIEFSFWIFTLKIISIIYGTYTNNIQPLNA